MDLEDERREARIEALTCVVGSILAVLDVKSDAVDLWPETMRKGTPSEIRQVTAELADVLPVSLFRNLRLSEQPPVGAGRSGAAKDR
jgi:hypothetical protein